MTNPEVRILLILFSLPALAASVAHAQIDDSRFKADLKTIAREPRTIGSIGYNHAAGYIESQLKSVPGIEVRRHEFPVMVPVTRSAQLLLGARDKPQNIYPFWPAQVRVNATPAGGITGRPIYIGEAHYNEIKPADVSGQIAVVEASAGGRWTNAFYFGAKAILVLGKSDTNNVDLRHHDVLVPVNLPRFYVPPGQLADSLRAGKVTTPVTLKAAVDWERKTAVNFYALIRPRSVTPPGWELKSLPGALMISVPYDAGGLVPDLAFGASQAVQAAAGLALVRDRFQVCFEARIIDLGVSYGRRQGWQAEEDQEDPNFGVGHS